MFDESMDVLNAKEIKSPANSEDDDDDDVSHAQDVLVSRPSRTPARRDNNPDLFELSESSPEPERFINDLPPSRKSPDKPQNITRMTERRPPLSQQTSRDKILPQKKSNKISDSSDNTDSDSNDLEAMSGGLRPRGRPGGGSGVVIPAEGAYDPQQFANLQVSDEMNELFQYILKYAPQKIDIDYKLKPFLPDYIPAVGDIDAFIKVETPQFNLKGEPLQQVTLDKIAELGLIVLDEPCPDQSDPALLHLQLRASSKSTSAKQTMVVKKLENADKNGKAIERWIKDVVELHQSKPPPNVYYTKPMPDIDSLMQEWPEKVEAKLNEVGFPPASMDCSLSQYVDIVCNIFDIPVHPETGINGQIQALHVLFTLYSAIKNSQLFEETQKDEMPQIESMELRK